MEGGGGGGGGGFDSITYYLSQNDGWYLDNDFDGYGL